MSAQHAQCYYIVSYIDWFFRCRARNARSRIDSRPCRLSVAHGTRGTQLQSSIELRIRRVRQITTRLNCISTHAMQIARLIAPPLIDRYAVYVY
jgi:hypothetical protein